MTNTLTSTHAQMLAIWQQHTYAEFVLKNAEAALETMSDNPYVLLVPAGTGGTGRAGVLDFYKHSFLPNIPADLALIPVSQIFSDTQIVEEAVARFTHTIAMDWMLPGLPPTNKVVEFVLVGIIRIENGKVANEHLYWDQASVLSQLGVLDHPVAAAGINSAAKLLSLTARPS